MQAAGLLTRVAAALEQAMVGVLDSEQTPSGVNKSPPT